MTQILFDLDAPCCVRGATRRPWPIPVLVGHLAGTEATSSHVRVHNETPGIVVPEHVQERYREGGGRSHADVGVELARELIDARRASSPQGVYVVAPFRQPLGVLDARLDG